MSRDADGRIDGRAVKVQKDLENQAVVRFRWEIVRRVKRMTCWRHAKYPGSWYPGSSGGHPASSSRYPARSPRVDPWECHIYLQQGRHNAARELLGNMRESLAHFPKEDPRMLVFGAYTHAAMAATLLVETEQWDAANEVLPPEPAHAPPSRTSSGANPYQAYAAVTRMPALFARGLAAARNGSSDAEANITRLRAMRAQGSRVQEPMIAQMLKNSEVQELEIAAVASASRGDLDRAIGTMRKATALEEAMPPPGPPELIKPSHELFGELLLRADRPREAAKQFATSLSRHAGRARSLLGAARAAARSGDTQGATEAYSRFVEQWRQGDPELAELQEARAFLQRGQSNAPTAGA